MIEREDIDGVAVVRVAHGPVNALDLELVKVVDRRNTVLLRGERGAGTLER